MVYCELLHQNIRGLYEFRERLIDVNIFMIGLLTDLFTLKIVKTTVILRSIYKCPNNKRQIQIKIFLILV